MKKRHAILIMAHGQSELLKKNIKLLDSEQIDFYIHIDKKSKEIKVSDLENICEKSNLYAYKKRRVQWGAYSICEVELLLMAEAYKKHYDYYHLISGQDLLIKPLNEFLSSFEGEKREYVAFGDDLEEKYIERVKYYYPMTQLLGRIGDLIDQYLVKIQKKLGVNRIKSIKWQMKKGAQWFSVSENIIKVILSEKKMIRKLFHMSSCSDEMFIQTAIFNSRNYDLMEEHNDCRRFIDWERGTPYIFKEEDFEDIVMSDDFFARKFDYINYPEIVDKICDYVKLSGGV